MSDDLKRDLFLGTLALAALLAVLWGISAVAYWLTGVPG